MRFFALVAATMALNLMGQGVNDQVDSLDHDDSELVEIARRRRRRLYRRRVVKRSACDRFKTVIRNGRDVSLSRFALNDIRYKYRAAAR